MESFDFAANKKAIQQRMGASDSQWLDWRWQMRNRILDVNEMGRLLKMSEHEIAGARMAAEKFRWALTPYSLALIDIEDPDCPVKKQIVPSDYELIDEDGEADPLCEIDHSPVPDLIHVYPDRVALCITDVCQAYCRHCFRKRRTRERPPSDAFDQAVEYIYKNKQIRDVLITGGDPLMFSDDKLVGRLERIRAIKHVQIIRIGTRAPSLLPMRVTPDLVNKLKRLHPLYLNVQFNHPRELTDSAVSALTLLADAGVVLGNQSVLLKGVNDDKKIMKDLLHGLLAARVRPYYIFHPQLVEGTAHLRTSLETGLDIYDSLEGHTSGLAVPLYILDTPYGKVPLSRSRIISRDNDGFTVRSFGGDVWTEKNPR